MRPTTIDDERCVELSAVRAHIIRRAAVALVLGAVCLLPLRVMGADTRGGRIEGRVVGATGAGLSGAQVRLKRADAEQTVTTGSDGRFALSIDEAGTWNLTVTKEGFDVERMTVDVGASIARPVVVLHRPIQNQITVVASRRPVRLVDTPSSVVALTADDLAAAGAARLDDALREVPGFSLFRRSGSRSANPTSQGVSLRGVGATGASRSLVLDDGIPLNDPFGGWVYWGRLPAVMLDRIEVLRGGASDLYGSSALSGAVNFVRRGSDKPFLGADASYGTEATHDVALAAGGAHGRWSGTAALESFRTDGYIPVGEDQRGPVDVPAGTDDRSADLTGEVHFGTGDRVFLRGAWLDESRENGTPLQKNDTDMRQASAGWDHQNGRDSVLLRLYGSQQNYDQSFSSVSASRNTETLTRLQTVPSDAAGFLAQWDRSLGRGGTVMLGGDYRYVSGRSDEQIVTPAGVSSATAGGRQGNAGIFTQATVPLGSDVSLVAGLRYDRWDNTAASSTSNGTTTLFPDRSATAWSPRVALLERLNSHFSFTSAAYGGFRSPTLNELYRGFRVGNTVTQANPDLEAERLWGFEAGLLFTGGSGRIVVRGNVFWMGVRDPIANVTVAQTPALITRRRENLGSVRTRGAEIDVDARLGRGWFVSGGYLFADSTVMSYPADPTLEGLRVPQVPRHVVTFQTRFVSARLGTIGIQARIESSAYEDDRNTLLLGRYFVLNALWSRALGRSPVALFVAGDNLTNTHYDIGLTPTHLVGAPATVRIGFRLGLGG